MNLGAAFKELVDRKLWPLAILLVAAVAAVPMLLKKDAAPANVPVAAVPAGPTGESPTDAIVSQSDAAKTDKVRAVLGDRKDPFRPADVERIPTPTVEPTVAAGKPDLDLGGSAGGGGGGGGGSDTSSSGSGTSGGAGPATDPVTTAVPTPVPTPAPVYEMHSLLVHFGDATAELTAKNPKRLTGLPAGRPAFLYLGLLKDTKTAVFVVDAGTQVQGDGRCTPSPDNCQTLTLKQGETEFFTRGEKTWELDLLKVIVKKTKVESEAVAARRAIAKGGRHTLAVQGKRAAGYTYDPATGFLSKATPTAKSAAVHHPSIAKTVALTTSG